MSISIFIIEYNDKEISGYQTFRKELVSGIILSPNITIGNIIIDSDYKTITIYIDNKVTKVEIPTIKGELKYERIAATLQLFIRDSSTNVFLCNFAPASSLLYALYRFYPQSKRVLVLHDFIAAYYLQGRLDIYNNILSTTGDDKFSHPPIGNIDVTLIKKLHREYTNAFKFTNNIVCLCDDTLAFIHSAFDIPYDKLTLIKNGLTDTATSKDLRPGQKSNPFRFIFVGRMTDNKGFRTLIGAIDELLSMHTDYMWEILCAGPINRLRLNEINSVAASRIRVLGSIPREQLYEIYPTINAGLILSKYEQCSYAGIEFKMFSLPVLAISSYGVKDMFNKHNSILIDANSHSLCKDVAIGMHKLISCDSNTRKKYAKKSRDDFINRYTSQNMAKRYLYLFSQLIQQ